MANRPLEDTTYLHIHPREKTFSCSVRCGRSDDRTQSTCVQTCGYRWSCGYRWRCILKPVPVSLFTCRALALPYLCLERYAHTVIWVGTVVFRGVNFSLCVLYTSLSFWMLQNEQELLLEQNTIELFPLSKPTSIHVYFKLV